MPRQTITEPLTASQRALSRAQVLNHPCPACHVVAGFACVGTTGKPRWTLHTDRWIAARQQREADIGAKAREIVNARPAKTNKKDRTPRPGSLTTRITMLNLGDITSHVVQAHGRDEIMDMVSTSSKVRDRVRNSVMSSVRAATEKTGKSYSVEVINVLMPSGLPITLAVIRREPTDAPI